MLMVPSNKLSFTPRELPFRRCVCGKGDLPWVLLDYSRFLLALADPQRDGTMQVVLKQGAVLVPILVLHTLHTKVFIQKKHKICDTSMMQ